MVRGRLLGPDQHPALGSEDSEQLLEAYVFERTHPTALAVGGFYLIPRKGRIAKQQFAERISELGRQLRDSMRRQAHQEISASADLPRAPDHERRRARPRQKLTRGFR